MLRRSPAPSYEEGQGINDLGDVGMPTAKPIRSLLIKLFVFALGIAVFVDVLGVPHVQTSYSYSGPQNNPIKHSAKYWSVTGFRHIAAYERDRQGLTLIALLPLETPLWLRAKNAATNAWETITSNTKDQS